MFFTLITSVLLFFTISAGWSMRESELKEPTNNKIFDFYQSLIHGDVLNSSGLRIQYAYSYRTAAKKAIIILPGRTEPAMKYAEFILDLKEEGIDAFILNHQGQGSSDRILNDPDKGHVENFNDYIEDMTKWMNEVVLPLTAGKDLYLFGHSMGGLIGTMYVDRNPDVFKKIILSAPLFELNTDPYGETIAKVILKFFIFMGKGQNYMIGKKPYNEKEDVFQGNHITHSLNRFNINKYIYSNWKKNILGGPTNNWAYEVIDKSQNIVPVVQRIKVPFIIFQAGLDHYVRPQRQKEFCRTIKFCKISSYAGAFHEIFNETDEIRDRAMRELLSFVR